jgi:uncharacterized membrane protein
MKNQPALQLPTSPLEKALDIAALGMAAAAFLLALYYAPTLPDQIPTHFNAKGEVDQLGSKITLFIIPGLAVATSVLLAFMVKKPHTFNYMTTITPENAAFEYKKSQYVVRIVNCLCSLLFLVITWQIIQGAIHHGAKLNGVFWVIVVAILVTPCAIFLTRKPQKNS